MKKILLIDDDTDIHSIVRHSLQGEFDFNSVSTIYEAKSFLSENNIDLIVLDEKLPDGNGSDFLNYLKEKSIKTIVIMLTANKELQLKLSAFDSGADDYMVKPFEPLELIARINARLKSTKVNDSSVFVLSDLNFNLNLQSLVIDFGDRKDDIDLTPIEFKILYLLATNLDKVYSREQILDIIWGKQNNVVDRTVDQHISKVRKKISASSYTVKSVHGKGYHLVEGND